MNKFEFDKYSSAGFESDFLDAEAKSFIEKLTAKYGQPSCGRSRATFTSKHCVIKFPLNIAGLIDNGHEARYNDETTAKGRKIMLGDFVCVMQERLTYPESRLVNPPSWVYSVDCMQVGYDKKGRLKAYDFGFN